MQHEDVGALAEDTRDADTLPPSASASAWWVTSVWFSVAAVLVFVLMFGVNVPFWDEWLFPDLLQKMDTGTLTWADLLQQHNEHRILAPRLIMLGLARLTAWNVKAEMLFTAAHLCLLLMVLYAQAARDYRFAWGRAPAWFVWIPPLVLNWRQYENLTWGFQIGLTLPLTASAIAFFSLTRAAEAVTICRWLGATAVAVVAALAASFSGPMGLLSWPLGFGLVTLALWRSNRKIPTALTWVIVGFAATGLYFHDYHSPPQHVGIASSQYVRILAFFLSTLGSAVTTKNQVALVVGSLSCAAIVAALTALVWRRRLEQRLFWVASVCMGLGTLGMVAYGRAGAPELATRSAYMTYSLFVLAAGLPLIVEALPARLRYSRIAMVATVMVLGLGVTNGYAIGYRTVVANRAALRQLREAVLDHCNRPNGHLAPLYRDTDVIRTAIRYLEPRRYSVFADSKQGDCRMREAPAPPPYKYGTAIRFGLAGDSRRYEVSGWSLPEEGLTWTDGPKATLRLLVSRPTRDLTLFFRVRNAYTEPGRVDRQRVIVGLNGIEVGTVVVAGPGRYTLGIPGRLVNEGENVLAFDLPDARSSVLGGRSVGVALHSMRLE